VLSADGLAVVVHDSGWSGNWVAGLTLVGESLVWISEGRSRAAGMSIRRRGCPTPRLVCVTPNYLCAPAFIAQRKFLPHPRSLHKTRQAASLQDKSDGFPRPSLQRPQEKGT